MIPPKFTTDKTAKRLRWLAVCVITFDNLNTLLGQPSEYWQHPETVQEGNHLTHFFISRGYFVFGLYELIYTAGAFVLASLSPKQFAVAVSLAFIFGHYYGASTWLAHRWHLGTAGTVAYGIVLSVVIVLLIFPLTSRFQIQASPTDGRT
jgi:hypothetical protein